MTSTDRFRLIGGRPCLDLVATLGRRHAVPVERLPDPPALADWLAAAGLLLTPPREVTPTHLGRTRTLREAVHRLVRAALEGRPLPIDDVTVVNHLAIGRDLVPQLLGVGELSRISPRPVDAALVTLARDTAELLGSPLVERIRECGHSDCSLLFLDDTPGLRRRWCSMDRCGNLVKIAAYRSRQR